jgi:hypothetical protein
MKIKKELELLPAIKEGLSVEMRCYTVTSQFLKNLEITLRSILISYNKAVFFTALFGALQEMIRWSCLANMRTLYYQASDLSLNPSKDVFIENEPGFLSTVSSHSIPEYRKRLKDNSMYIQCLIRHSYSGLSIQIFNHSKFTLNQEEYLRKYLEKAMKYSNIMEYFEDFPTDRDGRAMGLAFSIILLKEAGLRSELMRVGRTGSEGGYSRIEIPFDESFRSIRDLILNDEIITPFEPKPIVPPEYQEELQKRLSKLKEESSLLDATVGF